ncbi:hypothetical protein MN608_00944 [Microdochium nivale]|nr:hypothetical protein MN608_00944 [Microdochium nivale]
MGLQADWLDDLHHLPGSDDAGVAKFIGGPGLGIDFDISPPSTIDSINLEIDWSQLTNDLVDSHNASLNAVHTHGDFITQGESGPL